MTEPAPSPPPKRTFSDYLTDPSARRIEWLAMTLVVAFGLFVFVVTRGDLVAQVADPVPEPEPEAEVVEEALAIPDTPFTLASLDTHPDRRYAQYLAGAFVQSADSASNDVTLDDFRAQLDIYQKRMGVDDNFTVRVIDNRTAKTLEVYTLTAERDRFEAGGKADWDQIDRLRRGATNQLINKWTARGVPKPNVSIRWGRANQVAEARDRDEPYIEYEIRYARQLGMSLLPTEIGTVETFNQDWLVSSVGARSRYQMMPDILQLFDVHTYTLPAASGTVQVREELNPLLAMRSSFLLVRGYANAVGHEIPGVSAYHTGPGNIFHLYQTYLRAQAGQADLPSKSVIDAYMWGVTDGFERVRKQSSFGTHSRGYVLSAYGALRAQDEREIDPKGSVRAEMVQLKPGKTITLQALLTALEPHDGRLRWGRGNDDANLYQRFRAINPHLDLPVSGGEGPVNVPASGNVTLAATAQGKPVRVFLPVGARDVLERTGQDLIDEATFFPFNEETYADPNKTGEKTSFDRAYDRLVEDTADFGFTNANNRRLNALYSKFQELAAESPTPYRVAQLKIITIHRRVWGTRAFRDLAGTVQNVLAGRSTTAGAEPTTTP